MIARGEVRESEVAALAAVLNPAPASGWRSLLRTATQGWQTDDRRTRLRAADRLPFYGAAAGDPLAGALRDPDPYIRQAAARGLAELAGTGVAAREPLAEALRDSDPGVRKIALQALAPFPDHRLVPALVEALRDCFEGRSAKRQIRQGWLSLVQVPLLLAGIWAVARFLHPFEPDVNLALPWIASAAAPFVFVCYIADHRKRGTEAQGIAELLVRIAEADQTPELLTALPDLTAMSADALQQSRGARLGARAAAQRIAELATAPPLALPAPAPTVLPPSPGTEEARLAEIIFQPPSRGWRGLFETWGAEGEERLETRVRAVERLGGHGPAAVEALCSALTDRSEDVRVAAARSLGEIGDGRAASSLNAALRACFESGSARHQLRLWLRELLMVPVWAVIGAAILQLVGPPFPGHTGAAFYGIFIPLFVFQAAVSRIFDRRRRGREAEAVAQALARIAESDPSPELRAAIPELEAMSADRVQQRGSARRAARQAAETIGRVSPGWKDLPLPGSASESPPDALPRPAD